jgi:hypothetical protein
MADCGYKIKNRPERTGLKTQVFGKDRAGWHTAKKLDVPQGIHIIEMPSHSPKLQRCRKTMAAHK